MEQRELKDEELENVAGGCGKKEPEKPKQKFYEYPQMANRVVYGENHPVCPNDLELDCCFECKGRKMKINEEPSYAYNICTGHHEKR